MRRIRAIKPLDPTAEKEKTSLLRYRVRQEWGRESGGSGRKRSRSNKISRFRLGGRSALVPFSSKLEALGMADDTIVMHTSDHGDMMGAHGLFGKQVLFEEAARVPFLVRLPGQRQSSSIAQQVSQISTLFRPFSIC